MKIRARRERDLYPARGFGLFYTKGSTGTTYGEKGENMFFELTLIFLIWTWVVSFNWKRL